MPAEWQPLPLADGVRARVTAVIDEIAAALAQAVDSEPRPYTNAELALFFAYLSACSGDARHAELSLRFLNRAAALLGETETAPSLHGGFTGIAWADHHVSRLLSGGAAESSDVDEVLLEVVGEEEWDGSADLISGLAGFGVYFLERLPDETGSLGLERVIGHLAALAERSERGLTWHTPPSLLTEWHRELAPDGYYNLGMAHGVPGMLALLALAEQRGAGGTGSLVREAAAWLLSVRQPFATGSYYRTWLPSLDAPPMKSRTAWCYGDPGPAVALIHAGHAAEGLEILLATCTGSNEERGIVDAPLCHGAAGLMHLYNRIGQRLGSAQLRDAAVLWLERTLAFHTPGRFIGGFGRYGPPADRPFSTEREWQPAAGFLSGTAGIGLALIAAVSDRDPAWDRLLLLS